MQRMTLSSNHPFDYIWIWIASLPERKGTPCRLLAEGALDTVLVEFPDGLRVVTSRNAIRRGAPK